MLAKNPDSFEAFHKKVVANNSLSDDIPNLNDYENHYVFVYGTLMQGGSRPFLNPRDMVGKGRTLSAGFVMRRYAPGNFPVVYAGGDIEPKGFVNGELYLVPTSTIPWLDRIEANGYLYRRRATRVWSYRTMEAITAWMYFILPDKIEEQQVDDECIDVYKMTGNPVYSWNHTKAKEGYKVA